MSLNFRIPDAHGCPLSCPDHISRGVHRAPQSTWCSDRTLRQHRVWRRRRRRRRLKLSSTSGAGPRMTSPQSPCVLIAQLRFLVPDALQLARSSEFRREATATGALRAAPASRAPPAARSRHPPAPSQPRGTCTHTPAPPTSAPGRAGRCHNNWAPARRPPGRK